MNLDALVEKTLIYKKRLSYSENWGKASARVVFVVGGFLFFLFLMVTWKGYLAHSSKWHRFDDSLPYLIVFITEAVFVGYTLVVRYKLEKFIAQSENCKNIRSAKAKILSRVLGIPKSRFAALSEHIGKLLASQRQGIGLDSDGEFWVKFLYDENAKPRIIALLIYLVSLTAFLIKPDNGGQLLANFIHELTLGQILAWFAFWFWLGISSLFFVWIVLDLLLTLIKIWLIQLKSDRVVLDFLRTELIRLSEFQVVPTRVRRNW